MAVAGRAGDRAHPRVRSRGAPARPAARPRGAAGSAPAAAPAVQPAGRPAAGPPAGASATASGRTGPGARPGRARPRPGARRARGPPPCSFTVHVRPYAQRALLDGVEVASDEQRVVFSLAPGRAPAPHRAPLLRAVRARDRRRAAAERLGELKVPLVPAPGASSASDGDPATRVYLDGKFLGTAGDSQREPVPGPVPADGPNPYEGEVDLRLEAPGRARPASATVRVRAGQEITVPAVLTEDPPR